MKLRKIIPKTHNNPIRWQIRYNVFILHSC